MMGQQAFWNAVADTKEFSHPFDLSRFSALVPPRPPAIDRDAAVRVLDYGCG